MSDMVWIVDGRWHVGGQERTCRRPKCGRPAQAWVMRPRKGREYPWHYCDRHLYERRINGDRVEIQVSADSALAAIGHYP